ncbi:hypothetical protein CAPTEDRAFT_200210 [Capitella teleta]|uniref:Alpha-1,3-mannosyl-glycoprotein 2-beta-N-acetylglucosaminyltransferase n=1 Tax=Capitella teleta TaxID=283909 RepID=R7V376_CAPTE|nr:hypothetical protein CAPTEDRAFT_200210 [Capitella teleta]|eukprot:ELU10776.1 hypothetical protein CAPTEDRAFT_200210 [Capitella teleta]
MPGVEVRLHLYVVFLCLCACLSDASRIETHMTICVAVITVKSREPLVNRLLNQLHNLSLPFQVGLDINVFCDGNCSTLEMGNFPVFSLRPLIAEKPLSTATVRRITQMYRLVLDHIHISMNKSWCVILEDDLVLAPDALMMLYHGRQLMEMDPSIFTVSLFNDNSFHFSATDQAAFRRVSHFAGLGFIMTQRWYIDLIRPNWPYSKPWDAYFQSQLTKNSLVCIIPEVTRSKHVTNAFYSARSHIQKPLNSFESQYLANSILPEYNFSALIQSEYDHHLTKLIATAQDLVFIEDACFVDDGHFVYKKCNSQKMLNRILKERNLWGKGNGGVVRGMYRGLLQIRVCSSLVVILCNDSPFYDHNANNSVFATPHGAQSPLRGVIGRLQLDYIIVTGDDGLDCSQVCAGVYKECDVQGLFLLNKGCAVLELLALSCKVCSEVKVEGSQPYTGDMPAMLSDGNCCTGWPHHSSCFGKHVESKRICPCK